MVLASTSKQFTDEAADFLARAGYARTDIVFDYRYSLPTKNNHLYHAVADLVAFSGAPHTIRTACIAVEGTDNPTASTEDKLLRLRYLGAPLAIVGGPNVVDLWSLRPDPPFPKVDSANRRDWQESFAGRIADISSISLPAAKSGNALLAFIDAGFSTWAENITQSTVVSLLETLFGEAIGALSRNYTDSFAARRAVSRLVNQLFAARVLYDKEILKVQNPTAQGLLEAAHEQFPENFNPSIIQSPYTTKALVALVHERLKEQFAFSSLNTDMLGHAYENALVSQDTRQKLGIYYTPRSITNYILAKLPIEAIEESSRRFCDPCCGSGSFLLAGFDRLSGMLADGWTPARKHHYLRERLVGRDIDEFACEIARLSLILTDAYNRNGWNVKDADGCGLSRVPE